MKEKDFEKYIHQNTWFHGTTLKNWEIMCKTGVKCDYNKGLEADFGYGFYLAPKFDQAKSYITRMLPYLSGNENDKIPVVIEFKLNVSELIKQNYQYFRYLHFDPEFAEFVANCRLNPNDKIHNNDFIIGVMTDSNPLKLVNDYKNNLILWEELISGLLKWNSMEQISIHNQEICDTLYVEKVYNLIDEKEEDANEYNKRFFHKN